MGVARQGDEIVATTPDELKGRTLDLADLIAYQEGSVVSRTLIDRPTGTVTLFAFSEGQGLSEHTAPFDAMAQVLDGEAEVMLGDKPHKVGAGRMVIMPADIPHALRASVPFKMLLVMVRG